MEFLLLKGGVGDEPQFVRLTWLELKGLIAVKAGRIDFGVPRQLGSVVISEIDFLIFQTKVNSIAGTNFNFGQANIALKNAKPGFPIRFTIDSKNAGDTLTGFLATSGNSTVTLNGLTNQVVTVDQIGYSFLGGMRNDIEVIMIDTNRFEVFVNPKL